MAVVVIAFILIYLFIGCWVWSLSSNKYDTEDYPLLVIIFWPLMIAVEIFFELKDLLDAVRNDIKDWCDELEGKDGRL